MKTEKREFFDKEVVRIKNEFGKRFKELAGMTKAKLVTVYSDILGDEYIEAISRGQKLAERYKELINIAFEYAAQGGGKDLVAEISAYADEPRKNDKDKAEVVSQLLDRIMDILEVDYMDIVSLIKRVQCEMTENEEQISEIMSLHESELKDGRARVKEYFRKELEKMLYGFTAEIAELKRACGVESDAVADTIVVSDMETPVDKDIDFNEDFIPFKKSKGTLN